MIHRLAILATQLRAPIVYLHSSAAVNILATFSFNVPNLDGDYHNPSFCAAILACRDIRREMLGTHARIHYSSTSSNGVL